MKRLPRRSRRAATRDRRRAEQRRGQLWGSLEYVVRGSGRSSPAGAREDHRRSDTDESHRPQDVVETRPHPLEQHDRPRSHEDRPDHQARRVGCRCRRPAGAAGSVFLRNDDPGQDVNEDSRKPGEHQDGERESDENRIDAEVMPDTAADAGDDAIAFAAPERGAYGWFLWRSSAVLVGWPGLLVHAPRVPAARRRRSGGLAGRGRYVAGSAISIRLFALPLLL